MTNPSLSEDIQAIIAGYVLGDLDSDERKQFQQLLSESPELAQEIVALQETLSLLPYGLPIQRPNPAVRAQLLAKAQSPIIPVLEPKYQSNQKNNRIKKTRLLSSFKPSIFKQQLATAIAIILGSCSLILAHRVSMLQMRLTTANHVMKLAISEPTNSSKSSVLTIHPADSLLTEQWSGLTQIIQDHARSVTRSQGPVDLAATDPLALRKKLRHQFVSSDFPLNLSSEEEILTPLPTLPLPQAQLLGGSPCQFEQTKGLRMTYTLLHHPPISLYQIDLKGDQFPSFSDTYISVNQDDINLVVWKQDNYLYALAAELSQSHLYVLTQVMELI